MQRRQFLGLMAALGAAPAALPVARRSFAAADRATWWDPAPTSNQPGVYVALEWRYLAGRITTDAEDFGFVVSLADYNPLVLPSPLTSPISWNYQELLVMRQDFGGAQAHATRTYRAGINGGGISYNPTTATYTFQDPANPTISATWHLDVATQTYLLSVTTPELTLSNLLLTPVGQLIQEGGDGSISSGQVTVNNIPVQVDSDYYADWVAISSGGQELGYGRLDMQTLKPLLGSGSGGATAFSHHWFCLACTLADDTPAWVSAWQIISGATPVWGLTRATGRGGAWSVSSLTEEGFTGAQPLAVTILDWQGLPASDPARRTGRRWRVLQGQAAFGDALDLELSVPAGQFVQGARISTLTNIAMQESAGIIASGTVGGKAIKSVEFAIAESTYNELAPSSLPPRAFLPAVVR